MHVVYIHEPGIIGASLSEPRIDELNIRNLYIWGEPERAPHRRDERSQSIYVCIIGASLSEPHIDELHVRNLYIYVLWYIMVRPSPARRYIQCTATRDIFRRPHEETSALSGTTCIIIAESAKQIHSVCLSVRTCLEKGQVL